MTTIARICERWTMHLESRPGPDWYLDWCMASPKEKSLSMTAGWHAYSSLVGHVQPQSVWEPFGGVGAQSLMIRDLFAPAFHRVGEYTPEAVDHLRRVLPREIHVELADAYDPANTPDAVDMVALDFGDLTVWKLRDGLPHRTLLDRVFEAGPDAVVVTDVAGPRLHLHRERYETILGDGSCADYPTYLAALGEWFTREYGFSILAGFYHRSAAKMSMTIAGTGTAVPTPASPVGLELF